MSLSRSAQSVQNALAAKGVATEVVELPSSTRTADEAARSIGCEVGQIVKSLLFRTASDRPILILASGPNRVNEKAVAVHVGEPLLKADADFARKHTGFAIGGVPPVGHPEPLTTYIDEDLLQFPLVWAAAGTPNAVFSLPSSSLQLLTNGLVISVK